MFSAIYFLFVIFIHKPYRTIYLLLRSPLRLLLKTCQQYNQPASIEETKDSEYVSTQLYTYLKKATCPLNMFQIRQRYPVHLLKGNL